MQKSEVCYYINDQIYSSKHQYGISTTLQNKIIEITEIM